MAFSRLEKIGTIYSRVNGLLRSGALKYDDRPLWYDVYKAFPPLYEPHYDRKAPLDPVPTIFYEEDIIRAKFYKAVDGTYNLVGTSQLDDKSKPFISEKFIARYKELEDKESSLDSEQIFQSVMEEFESQHFIFKKKETIAPSVSVSEQVVPPVEKRRTNVQEYLEAVSLKQEKDEKVDFSVKGIFDDETK